MFVPPLFAETDLSKLHEFIIQHSFGMIVSQVDGLPFATHIPFLLRPKEGQYGMLVGHVARANPHWRQFAGQTSMVVFTGPHVYVSPTWYEAQHVVPTWNYTAVHAYGRVEVIDGGEALLDILKDTVQVYEHGMPEPWTFDGEGTFAERMMTQIVGFRMLIEKIEGKFKLSQNQPLGLVLAYPLSIGPAEFVLRCFDRGPIHDEIANALGEFYRPLFRLPPPITTWIERWATNWGRLARGRIW